MATSVLVAFGLWAALNGLTGPIAMFLNGANVIWFQVICASAMGVANLGLSIVLVRSIGVAGAIFASAITHGFHLGAFRVLHPPDAAAARSLDAQRPTDLADDLRHLVYANRPISSASGARTGLDGAYRPPRRDRPRVAPFGASPAADRESAQALTWARAVVRTAEGERPWREGGGAAMLRGRTGSGVHVGVAE